MTDISFKNSIKNLDRCRIYTYVLNKEKRYTLIHEKPVNMDYIYVNDYENKQN
jgi:hypothetical protein